MKYLYIIIFFFITIAGNAQRSTKYLEIINSIPVSNDSILYESKFNNGKIRESVILKYYKFAGKEYSFPVGKHTFYFKNNDRNETVYDNFGALMSHTAFDSNNRVYYQSNTIYVSTSASSIKEFLESDKHITCVKEIKQYKFLKKSDRYFLYKEGLIKDGRKVGKWTTYFPDGSIKKEKQYKNVVQQ